METSDATKKEKLSLEELPKEELLKQLKKTLSLLQTAKTKYTEINKRCGDLQAQRDDLLEVVSLLKSKNNVDSIEELEKKIISFQEANEAKALEIRSFEEQLKGAKHEKENLLRQCSENEEQVTCMKMQMDTLRSTCQCLQEEVSKLSSKNNEMKSENEVLTSARDTALEALHGVKGKLSSTEAASSTLQSTVDELKHDNNDLKSELAAALESKENAFKAFSMLEEESAEITKKYQALCADKDTLQASVNETKELLEVKDQQLNALKEHCKELEALCSSMKEEISELEKFRQDSMQSEKNSSMLCEENDKLKADLLQMKNDNQALNEEVQSLRLVAEKLRAKFEQDLLQAKEENDALLRKNQTLQGNMEALSTKMQNVSETLSSYEAEKNAIALKLQTMLEISLVCENKSFVELFDSVFAENENLRTLVSSFKKDNVSENFEELTTKCERYQYEIKVLSEKLGSLMQDNTVLKLEVEQNCLSNRKLEKEKSQLVINNSVLVEKLDHMSKEVDMLKQQLDEYENDIQKHLNLEKENYELQDLVSELQRENEKLSECLDNKCEEMDDIMSRVQSLIISMQNRVDFGESHDALKSANTSFYDIVTLESLCDFVLSRFSEYSQQIEMLGANLEEAIKAKEHLLSELTQVQDLKQFLEDEVNELREECEQLKVEISHSDTRESIQPETSEFGTPETAVEPELATERPVSNFQSEKPPAENDPETTIKKLLDENHDLMGKLVDKSQLVDSIHCQLDVVLSKVEEQNEEMEYKQAELEKANARNADLQKQVKDLQNAVFQMQTALRKMSHMLLDMKDIKEQVPELIQQFAHQFQSSVSDMNDEIETMKTNYCNCYNVLEKYRAEWVLLKEENSHLRTSMYRFSEDLTNEIMSLDETQRTHIQGESFKELEKDSWEECEILSCSSEKLLTRVHKLKSIFKNIVHSVSALTQKNAEIGSGSYSTLTVEKQNSSDHNIPNAEAKSQQSCSKCTQLQKDLAETETKMGKFKAVALKWKKELTELKQKHSSLSTEKEKLEEDSAQLVSSNRQYVQNFQSLQNEYDKLQDEAENMKSEKKTLQSDLALTINELSNFKLKLDEMKSEVKKAEEHLAASEAEKCQLKSKIADLESQLIISDSKIVEVQGKIQSLKNDILRLEKEKSALGKEKQEVDEKLAEALKESKQHSLMDLEMADYERTIAELNESLDLRGARITELEEDVEIKSSKIQSLEEEMKFCETHRNTETQRAEGFKKALEDSKNELSRLHESETYLKNRVSELCSKVEAFTFKEEDYKARLSEQSAEVEQMKEMLRSSGQNHERIVKSLKSKVSSLEQEVLVAHKEVESVKQDYENYKIRVHSVLKQQKNVVPFTTSDAEAKEQLESQNEKLKLQLKDMSEKILALNLEGDTLRIEHEHLLQRHNKVVEELEAKDLGWSKRLESVNEDKRRLQLVLENITSEQALKNEMLTTSYKKQMQMLQSEHKRDLDELQKQLDAANAEASRLQREQQKLPAANSSAMDESFSFDILSQERQEGEGSECADGESTPVRHLSLATIPTSGFMPLEKLIQSPDGSHTPTSMISNQDSERLSNELNASWKKIDHLTELLNESEANNVRWSEQVRVLKEEVRRLERNKLREEHGKNLEYLKNVFLKFTTLQPGREKAMLIPVLNTILTLSPEEVQQLKMAAGDDSEPDSSTGWGNYLHRWSGLM